MRPCRTPRRLLLLAAIVLLLPATPALAAREPALEWPGPEIAAGQVVELSWSDVPAGFDELEILLSLDDGHSFPVRVSPELDASERCYRWRVPNLPAAHARLRMRLGREHAEIETAPTPSFRIAGSESEPAARHLVLEGSLWTGLEPLGSDECGMCSPETGMEAGTPAIAVVEAPARPSALRPASASSVSGSTTVPSARASRTMLATRHPRLTPLRI